MARFAATVGRLAVPLGVLAFWLCMTQAARAYGGYDWPYQTLSVLLYSDRNPHGYGWAWAALELSALFNVAGAAQLRRRSRATAIGTSALAVRALQVGFVSMGCAVLPDRVLPLPQGHELFAIVAFFGIGIGVMRQMWAAGSRQRGGVAALRAAIPMLPVALAAVTQAQLALQRPGAPWVSPAWRTLGIPLYLSFALWEWASCLLLSVCLLWIWVRAAPGPRVTRANEGDGH
jgi:hypothetical protein